MNAPSPKDMHPDSVPHLHIAGIENEKAEHANPLTPTLRPPTASEIVKAVLERAPLIPRAASAKRMTELGAPEYLCKKVLACGEMDPAGDPHEQFHTSLSALESIDYARKVYGIEDDFLTKAVGQESSNLVHFGEAAGVELDL